MGTTLAHLLHTYQKEDRSRFGACYVCPPVGNFTAHETTTNKNVRILPSHWDESWCQGGTRKDEKCGFDHTRWLCHYTLEGNPDWIAAVQPSNDTNKLWKTLAPAAHPDEGNGGTLTKSCRTGGPLHDSGCQVDDELGRACRLPES